MIISISRREAKRNKLLHIKDSFKIKKSLHEHWNLKNVIF